MDLSTPVSELHARLLPRPLQFALTGGDPRTRRETIQSLHRQFPQVVFTQWSPNEQTPFHDDGSPAVVAWLGAQEEDISFERLPSVSRLDISRMKDDPLDRLREVIHSALGE